VPFLIPLAVPHTWLIVWDAQESGIPEEHIRLTTYQNALTAICSKWTKWMSKMAQMQRPLDQTDKKNESGNSVLRGGHEAPRSRRLALILWRINP